MRELQGPHSPIGCHGCCSCRCDLWPVPGLVVQMFAHSCLSITQFCSWVSRGVRTKPGRMLTSSQRHLQDLICCSLARDLPWLPRVTGTQTRSPALSITGQSSRDVAAAPSPLPDLRRGQGPGKHQDMCWWWQSLRAGRLSTVSRQDPLPLPTSASRQLCRLPALAAAAQGAEGKNAAFPCSEPSIHVFKGPLNTWLLFEASQLS